MGVEFTFAIEESINLVGESLMDYFDGEGD